MGVISGRIPERYFPPPFYSLPPGEGKVTFYEAVKSRTAVTLFEAIFGPVFSNLPFDLIGINRFKGRFQRIDAPSFRPGAIIATDRHA